MAGSALHLGGAGDLVAERRVLIVIRHRGEDGGSEHAVVGDGVYRDLVGAHRVDDLGGHGEVEPYAEAL